MTIVLAGEEIELLAARAFFWKRQGILGLSDVHLGKATSFQRAGIPIPTQAHSDLQTLARLVATHNPQQVFILGDWIHQKDSWTQDLLDELSCFFNAFSAVQWTLILGNHERGSIEMLGSLPLCLVHGEASVPPFVFAHGHGEPNAEWYSIQGHTHPVVKIKEGSIRLRLPCFVVGEKKMTIPSFGQLTGGFEVHAKPGERIFAVTDQVVFEVP